jgi:hypothetical protein
VGDDAEKKRDTDKEYVLEYHGPVETIPRDVELEAPFSSEEVTPQVRVCPDCTDDQVDAGDGTRMPESYGEACAVVRCWGTTDPDGPRWCRTHFTATWKREGKRVSFDKRKGRP